jgi:hypothetical protein
VVPTVSWVKTFPEAVTALATDAQANTTLFLRTSDGAAPTRLDAGGNLVWARPGVAQGVSFHGLSVAPTTGELLAWGWQDNPWSPGSSVVYTLDAAGTQPRFLAGGCDECSLGPYFQDTAGNVLSVYASSLGSSISLRKPDGGWAWSLRYNILGPSPTPFDYGASVFDSRADVLVAGTLEGQGHFQGRTFGEANAFSLVVLKLSSQGQLVWARELPVSRGRVSGLGTSNSGAVVVLGEYSGTLTWPGGVSTHGLVPKPFLMALDPEGTPVWVHSLPAGRHHLAVSPSGSIAVANEVEGVLHCREYDPEGNLRWSHSWAPADDSGRLMLSGIAWSGQDVLLGGHFTGAVDFGTGLQQAPTDPYSPAGFVLKLRRP